MIFVYNGICRLPRAPWSGGVLSTRSYSAHVTSKLTSFQSFVQTFADGITISLIACLSGGVQNYILDKFQRDIFMGSASTERGKKGEKWETCSHRGIVMKKGCSMKVLIM